MNDERFAQTPEPQYYAVIFASRRVPPAGTDHEYDSISARMNELARVREGFLGQESARDLSGFGVSISYWRDEAAIAAWKADVEHREAQRRGIGEYYDRFVLRVARVERQRKFLR